MLPLPTFDYIKDQVIITDPDGIIIFANAVVEEVTGYKISEIIGKKPSLWGGQMPKAFYKTMWQKIREEKKSVKVVVTNKRKNGKLYDAILRISPILDTEGQVKMYVGIETILTETV